MRWLSTVGLAVMILSGCASRSAPPTAAFEGVHAEERFLLQTPTGTLHGTLLLPSEPGPHPAALIIAGSGPTDRDGNSVLTMGSNDSLKLLAEGLAARGIATVRFDKRGVGESAAAVGREEDLRFDTYIQDAAGLLRQLAADRRTASVGVIGHSEGSLIGMVAARIAEADFFVSIAGAGRPAAGLLRDQIRPQLPDALWESSERILGSLLRGDTVADVPPALGILYRPSVQPYLISWLPVDPVVEIADLEVPILIAHGSTDTQVPPAESELLRAARPDARYEVVAGMNHMLKLVPVDPAQQLASLSDPGLPVAPRLIELVTDFVQEVAP